MGLKKSISRINYVPQDEDKEHNFEPSETVQGDSLSLKDLLSRLAMGMPLTKREGQFIEDSTHDDYDLEKVTNSDIVEQTELFTEADEVQNRWKEIQKKRKKQKEEKVTDPQGPGGVTPSKEDVEK